MAGAAGAQALTDEPALAVSVRTSDPKAPVLVLTNVGTVSCQVATASLGTITLNRVEQSGAVVEPIYFDAAFDDGLERFIDSGLRTVAPGASAELPIRVVPLGPTGAALETVAFSAISPLGALFPLEPDKGFVAEATYAAPAFFPAGGGLCPTATTARRADTAGAAPDASSGRDGPPWAAAAAALVIVGLVGWTVVRRGRRRRRVQPWRRPARRRRLRDLGGRTVPRLGQGRRRSEARRRVGVV